ncbi:MAG: TRAP transporter substrate-binding protein [Pseudomonadota bacterium]
MRLTALGFVGAAALSLLATTAAQATTIRVAGNFASDHSSSIAMETFEERVEELSGGAMTVQLFPNMQLGGAQENVDQVRTGAVQMTWIGIAFLSRLVPELEAVSLPFVFGNREQAFRVIDGVVGEKLDEAMRERGLTSLGYMELGARHVTNGIGPIERAADLEGLRLRMQPNETHLATFRALGANPVAMDISEVYSALQQGVLDGQENPYSIITTRNFYEVQQYLSDTSHFFDFIVTVANADWLDGLPDDQRAIVVEAMDAANARQRELAIAADGAALEQLQELGMVFTPLSDEARAELQRLTAPVVDELRARIGDELIDLVLQGAAES